MAAISLREWRQRMLATVAAAALVIVPASAFAQESPAGRLFREGRALMLESRFDEACPMLEQSQKLEPHVGTLLNVAACHERQGKVGSAWVEYQKALTAARAEGQSERAQLAEHRIRVLEPRVPWLRISSGVDDVTILLDGSELARVAWTQEMPVDPGVHVIAAERQGAKVFEERLDLREAEHRSVRVSLPAPMGEVRLDPSRLVIEPTPSGEAPKPPTAKGRWILEPGIFAGYLGGSASHPRMLSGEGVQVDLIPVTSGQPRESCGTRSCTAGELTDGGGGAGGISIFGGYALSDHVELGGRILAAPSLGKNGPSVFSFGPAIRLRATDSVSFGFWAMFGEATFKGTAVVTPPSGFNAQGGVARAEGGLAGGFGAGVELSVRLFELGRGTVVANTTPFFLSGNGNAWAVPLGVAYRFQ